MPGVRKGKRPSLNRGQFGGLPLPRPLIVALAIAQLVLYFLAFAFGVLTGIARH